ncbi:hypothetical protein CIB48_g2562 [Xylaria polymorpha]|nr:hypothetical protein CIB48_g2562 [Xylaria polymorpha]
MSADQEWKVIHYDDVEPWEIRNRLPVVGRASCLKILVPRASIKKYTMKEDTIEGETLRVLENPLSHVVCSIYMFNEDPSPGAWVPFMRHEAEWDGLPARNGYFTFYGVSPVSPLWEGFNYYHNLEFHDANTGYLVDDASYYSDAFRM